MINHTQKCAWHMWTPDRIEWAAASVADRCFWIFCFLYILSDAKTTTIVFAIVRRLRRNYARNQSEIFYAASFSIQEAAYPILGLILCIQAFAPSTKQYDFLGAVWTYKIKRHLVSCLHCWLTHCLLPSKYILLLYEQTIVCTNFRPLTQARNRLRRVNKQICTI